MRLFILPLLFILIHGYGQDKLRPAIHNLPVAGLKDSGFNQDSIEHLLKTIETTPPYDFRGVVVIKDNKLVIEEYFNTFWRNSVHDIRSAGKSITALLLGIALRDGLVRGLDETVYSFFPASKYPYINSDYKKITLRHLLDMSSGLDADENRPRSVGHPSNWIAKDNWKEYILKVPVVSRPGEKWIYADINAMLIGAVIEETSGLSLKDFAQKRLFAPLEIRQFYWYTNSSNQTGAAGNLYLSTLDFAKIGLLIANAGKWENIQIVDGDYIQKLQAETFNISSENPFAEFYGMMWYKTHRTFGNKNVFYLFASGNGGNHLVVIPDRNIVIALTSSAYGQRYAHQRSYTIVSKILDALK